MSLLRPLDAALPIEHQLGVDASPVVLVNLFTRDKADEPTFLKEWQDDAEFVKRQVGFISTELHCAIGASPTYLRAAAGLLEVSGASAARHQSADYPYLARAPRRCRALSSFRSRRRSALAHVVPQTSSGAFDGNG